jgi:pimeloyl-ACP methyl ester carboxylesterase
MTSRSVDYAFLHGGGQGGWVWDETVAALKLQAGVGAVRAIQLDVPGCGAKRGRDTSATGVREIAAELIADIVAADLRDVVLVGHSQAGQLLPIMLELRPDLFRRAIFVSCLIQRPGQALAQLMGTGRHGEMEDAVGWPFDFPYDQPDRFEIMFMNDMGREQVAEFSAKLGRDTWPPSSYAFTDWRLDHLPGLACTYVICLQDQILPPSWQERFAARAGISRLVRVDAAHQVMNTRPHALAEILRRG